jgi:hypothetical protein
MSISGIIAINPVNFRTILFLINPANLDQDLDGEIGRLAGHELVLVSFRRYL